MTIEAKGGMEGLLTDPTGAPLGEAGFTVAHTNDSHQTIHGITKPDGIFVLVHALKPGRYPELTLTVAQGEEALQTTLNDIEITSESIVDLGTLVVRARP